MPRSYVFLPAIASAIMFFTGSVLAGGAGQEDLDKATAVKGSAETIGDLNEVVRLVESAIQKGLDKADVDFAEKLLAATLFQRAQEAVEHLAENVASPDDVLRLYRSVLDDLNRSVRLDPKQPRAYLLIAELKMLGGGGELKDVLDALDRTISLGRDDPDPEVAEATVRALVMRAGLHEDPKKMAADLSDAAAGLRELLKIDPKETKWLLQLAAVQTSQKKSAEAIATYAAVLAESPDEWRALLGRGDAYLNVGRHAEAIADYERMLKIQPENQDLLNNFAWVLATSPDAQLRDGRRALRLATKACEATRHRAPHILSTLAAACAETGDFDAAVRWSSKAVELGGKSKIYGESLRRELKSYQAGKPWRERLSEETPGTKKTK